MWRRLRYLLLFLCWGIVLFTIVSPLVMYVVWGIDWIEVGHKIEE